MLKKVAVSMYVKKHTRKLEQMTTNEKFKKLLNRDELTYKNLENSKMKRIVRITLLHI